MKYSEQQQLYEIMGRGEKLRQKKERRVIRGLATSASALAILLTAFLSTLGQRGSAGAPTDYGSFLLAAEAGGYVLAAVIAFALGVVVTVLIHRYRGRDRPESPGEKNDNEKY